LRKQRKEEEESKNSSHTDTHTNHEVNRIHISYLSCSFIRLPIPLQQKSITNERKTAPVKSEGATDRSYLRKTWWICWANEAKRAARARNNPPRTAVSLVDLRRQRATTSGAHNQLPLSCITPIQTVREEKTKQQKQKQNLKKQQVNKMDSLEREGNKKTIERSKRTKRRLVTVVSACVSDVFLNGLSFLFCGRKKEKKKKPFETWSVDCVGGGKSLLLCGDREWKGGNTWQMTPHTNNNNDSRLKLINNAVFTVQPVT